MLKNLIILIIIISIAVPQQYCYTEEEIIEIHDIIKECDFKEQVHFKVEENLSSQIKNLELNLEKHKLLISELETQLKLKDDLIKEVKPKWHENKYLWFGYGIVAIILPTWVLGNVK